MMMRAIRMRVREGQPSLAATFPCRKGRGALPPSAAHGIGRLRLAEQLSEELGSEPLPGPPIEPPSGSRLVLKNGFYVFTGPVEQADLDHWTEYPARKGKRS